MHSADEIADLGKIVINTKGEYGVMLGDTEVQFKKRHYRYLQGPAPSEGGMFLGRLQGKATLLSWHKDQTVVLSGEEPIECPLYGAKL